MPRDDRTIASPVGAGRANERGDVRQVQHLLNQHRAIGETRLAEDGIFGPETDARLHAYQREIVGLKHPDGVADPQGPTMQALSGAPSTATDATMGVSDYVARHPVAPQTETAKTDAAKTETAKTRAWIDAALPAARSAQEKWGVPASVTIAQGALESAWGTRHPGNEYFGIEGHAPDGKSVAILTEDESGGTLHAETDNFRSYGSLAQSADDDARFLATNKRYAAAFDHKDDAHRFLHEIAKAGYATDSHYETKVGSIIDQHDLTRYDSVQRQVRNTQPAPSQSLQDQGEVVLGEYRQDRAERRTGGATAAAAGPGLPDEQAHPGAEAVTMKAQWPTKQLLAGSVVLLASVGPALAVYSDTELIAHVRQAVTAHRLVDNPDCVDFVITRKIHPLIDQVELREHHGGKCGGDPDSAPRLFDVIVDRRNGQMASNAADPAGDGMQMLK